MSERDWVMGQLAAQDEYQPVDGDVWGMADANMAKRKASMARGWQASLVPDVNMNPYAASPQEMALTDKAAGEGFDDWMIPKTPSDVAFQLALGAPGKMIGKVGRMALAAGGLALDPDEAEAGVGSKLFKYGRRGVELVEDPWHAFSGIRSGNVRDTDLMNFNIEGLPNFERKLYKPEDLMGKEIIFTPGDLTRAGGHLTEVGGTKLASPQQLQGGADYPFWVRQQVEDGKLSPADAERLWANAQPQSSGYVNLGNKIREQGRDPVLMYLPMGKRSLDSAKQMFAPAIDLAKQGSVTDKAAEAINKVMEGKRDWPGWRASQEALMQWGDRASGKDRSELIKAMDTGEARKGGFPDMGQLRFAMTDPRLHDVPAGSPGLTVSRFDPAAGIEKVSGHGTYPTAVLGSDPGTLGVSLPWHLAAPDIHQALMRKGDPVKFAERPAYYMEGRVPKDVPRTQVVDRQWVDTNSDYIERVRRGELPALGSLFDPAGY
jgi:hypothetical protein